MPRRVQISPSLLASDFAALGDAVRAVEKGGADLIHVDVMDGHFVPNITIGIPVVRALKAAAGTGAEVKTSGYSLQPMRVYRENQPPTITGYEARNSVTVTTSDLTKLGNIIDTAGQAGANDIGGISFTLRQDRPARDRALQEATREALSKARVMAQALGGRVVGIAEVQEEGFIRPPQPVYQAEAFMAKRDAVATPVEIGALDITSRVLLVALVEVNP